jgi:hypothetical protein
LLQALRAVDYALSVSHSKSTPNWMSARTVAVFVMQVRSGKSLRKVK